MPKTYDPKSLFVCIKGAITLPGEKGGPRRVIKAGETDANGQPVTFDLSHRADEPEAVAYLVDVLKIVKPAPQATKKGS